MVTVYVMDRSTATLAWYTGVMGAYDRSNLAGKVGQIVQRLCHVQFWHVPFYAACYSPTAYILGELCIDDAITAKLFNGTYIGTSSMYFRRYKCKGSDWK